MKIQKLLIFVFFLLIFYVRSWASFSSPIVRVAILKDLADIELSIQGKYSIVDLDKKTVIKSGRTLRRTETVGKDSSVLLSQEGYSASRIRFTSSKEIKIYYDNKELRYRGDIDVIGGKNGKLTIVNNIDLERYVKGVLYHEISDRWPLEAIKAQAVAVRTYALNMMKVSQKKMFDVTSDTYSQVYGGRNAEHHRTNLGANRTKGQVMVYDGKILPAYFHSNCGGHTENAGELWNHDLAVLKGVKCPYCVALPNYKWKKNFRSSDIQEKLNQNGYHLGLIKNIEVKQVTDSGRAKMLVIETRDGKKQEITAANFRSFVGPNLLKSSKFRIVMKGYYFDVEGNGWGHGVGMCQWGVYGMSKQRKVYTEILEFYYPGMQLVDYRVPANNHLIVLKDIK